MLKNTSMKNITEILQNSSLSRIVQRANTLNDLNQKIKTLLPEKYRGLYRVANLVDNQLVIEVRSATVRQGMLLEYTTLLCAIQRDFPQVQTIQINLNPNFSHTI